MQGLGLPGLGRGAEGALGGVTSLGGGWCCPPLSSRMLWAEAHPAFSMVTKGAWLAGLLRRQQPPGLAGTPGLLILSLQELPSPHNSTVFTWGLSQLCQDFSAGSGHLPGPRAAWQRVHPSRSTGQQCLRGFSW